MPPDADRDRDNRDDGEQPEHEGPSDARSEANSVAPEDQGPDPDRCHEQGDNDEGNTRQFEQPVRSGASG